MRGSSVLDGVLFDLDGTLIDSREDLAAGANRLLTELGLTTLETAELMTFVGRGARGGGRGALDRVDPEVRVSRGDDVLRRFLGHYTAVMLATTRPFDDVVAGLATLHDAGVPMGVLSNKPHEPTVEMVRALDLERWFAVVLGSGAVPERKPGPGGLLFAAERLGVSPDRCLYVGDSDVDVDAARAAGMPSLWCSWGGIHLDRPADCVAVDHFGEVVERVLGFSP